MPMHLDDRAAGHQQIPREGLQHGLGFRPDRGLARIEVNAPGLATHNPLEADVAMKDR